MARRLLLQGLLMACIPAGAVVTEKSMEQKYTAQLVQGQSVREALNAATPIRQDGRTFYGFTAWNVTWKFWWHGDAAGRCHITRVQTSLTSTVQLPRLQGGTPAQQEEFDRFERALRQHEQGHVYRGQTAARAIDNGISALAQAPNCILLEQRANALGKRLLNEHIALEKEYDRTTGNGTTQGVTLP